MSNVVDQRVSRPILRLVNLKRTYQQGDRTIHVLDGASADFREGETVALVAPSGAGKTTLLQVAGLLDRPESGSIMLGGRDCAVLNDRERTHLRRTEIGFIYQFHHLLPEFSALENVAMPQRIAGKGRAEAEKRAAELLTTFGLAERLTHRPAQLSGGEQQRVAIARAVANSPLVLFADEPTGNLDPDTSERVFQELLRYVKEAGLVALIATHNYELAHRMDRILRLDHGKLVEEKFAAAPAREAS